MLSKWLLASALASLAMTGTKTRCELEAPTAEAREEWRRFQRPRTFGKATVPELLKLSEPELVMEINARLLDERYSTGLGAMTTPERSLVLINELEGEVNNGGFHQYFANSSGDCAALTRLATAAVDAKLSRIFEQALARFPNSSPAEDRATRNAQMASLDDEWGAWTKLDDEFYKLSFDAAIARHFRSNFSKFDGPPQSP